MEVIKYEHDKHWNIIENWAKERGEEINPLFFSTIGYVVYKDGKPLMATWLYFYLDCHFVTIDNLIAAPKIGIRKIREAWSTLFRVIKDTIRFSEESTGKKYHIIRCVMKDRLKHEAIREGFIINSNDIRVGHYIL